MTRASGDRRCPSCASYSYRSWAVGRAKFGSETDEEVLYRKYSDSRASFSMQTISNLAWLVGTSVRTVTKYLRAEACEKVGRKWGEHDKQ
jgi:hypothetical protein